MTKFGRDLIKSMKQASRRARSGKLLGMRVTKVYRLNDKKWKEFVDALENPPKQDPGLRRLLTHKPIWEK